MDAPDSLVDFHTGGSGYVGREVCKRAVERGWEVASLSRRGENPLPGDAALDCVEWTSGDAADAKDVQQFVKDADAVVHAVGLLFDVDSGLTQFSKVVSGSNSVPGSESTYDRITRQTAFNAIDATAKCISDGTDGLARLPPALAARRRGRGSRARADGVGLRRCGRGFYQCIPPRRSF